jgi:hypothetical protein
LLALLLRKQQSLLKAGRLQQWSGADAQAALGIIAHRVHREHIPDELPEEDVPLDAPRSRPVRRIREDPAAATRQVGASPSSEDVQPPFEPRSDEVAAQIDGPLSESSLPTASEDTGAAIQRTARPEVTALESRSAERVSLDPQRVSAERVSVKSPMSVEPPMSVELISTGRPAETSVPQDPPSAVEGLPQATRARASGGPEASRASMDAAPITRSQPDVSTVGAGVSVQIPPTAAAPSRGVAPNAAPVASRPKTTAEAPPTGTRPPRVDLEGPTTSTKASPTAETTTGTPPRPATAEVAAPRLAGHAPGPSEESPALLAPLDVESATPDTRSTASPITASRRVDPPLGREPEASSDPQTSLQGRPAEPIEIGRAHV